jgi:hypothetical protein
MEKHDCPRFQAEHGMMMMIAGKSVITKLGQESIRDYESSVNKSGIMISYFHRKEWGIN